MGTVTLWTIGMFLIITLEINMYLQTACAAAALNLSYMHKTETCPSEFFEHLWAESPQQRTMAFVRAAFFLWNSDLLKQKTLSCPYVWMSMVVCLSMWPYDILATCNLAFTPTPPGWTPTPHNHECRVRLVISFDRKYSVDGRMDGIIQLCTLSASIAMKSNPSHHILIC